MANIKSAKKRIRVIEKKTARNVRVKNHIKEAEKAFLTAINAGDVPAAEKAFKLVEKKLMQAVAKGTFHKNTASRTIGRYEAKLNAIKSGKIVEMSNEPAKKKAKKKVEPVVEETPVEAPAEENVEEAPAEEAAPEKKAEEKPANEETKKAEKPKVDASMKKDELLAVAKELGIDVPSNAKKSDIIAAIEAK